MHCLVCKKPIPKNSARRLCQEHSDASALFKSVNLLKSKDFYGKSPNIFVGSYNYPNVNVGILSPPERKEDTWLYDAPSFWAEQDFDKNNIISLRSSLINSKFQTSVKQSNKLLELTQEIAMASRPVDIDISLEKKPKFKLNINDISMPHGPKAELKSVKLAENPSIQRSVDKTVSDTDFKSTDALKYLYNRNINENDLIKLLSVGNLGIKIQRKLVPTRWSITAVHDQLGKHIIESIKDNNQEDYKIYFGGYMNNYFLIMLFPDVWAYELFETYVPDTLSTFRSLNCTTDFEFYQGRKSYAKECAGGYYASRLAILEKLKSSKKQASVIVLRFTTSEYNVSLGVWVVLEASRKAMQSQPFKFDSKEDMLKSARDLIFSKFSINIDQFLKKSQVLNYINTQSKLTSFT